MTRPGADNQLDDNLDAIKLRLRRQNDTLMSLARRHIGSRENLLAAVHEMNEAASETLESNRASVWFYTDNSTNVRCIDLFERDGHTHSDGLQVSIGKFPSFYQTFNSERTVAIEDTENDPRTREFHEGFLAELGVRSLLISAIWVDGAVAGLVCHSQTEYLRKWTLDEHNFITCIASTIAHWMDIAERHAAEERLHGMQFSIDCASDGVLWVGADAQIQYANHAASRMLGYTAEELKEKRLFDIAPRLSEEAWPRNWESVKQRGAVTYESVQLTKQGGHVPVEISLNHIHFQGQEYQCAFIRNITERKAAQSEIERQRSFFRKVIDTNPNLIFAKDRQGRFVLVNQAIADVYGTTVNDLLGKSGADFNGNPEEIAHFRADDLEVMNTGKEKFIAEERITDHQGRVRYLQTVKKPIVVGADGQADQILGVSTDITDRKRYEEEQRRLVLQMQHAQKLESLGVLAGGIAHDFNNLLMGIIGNAALAEIELDPDSTVIRRVTQITTAAKRAAELTNQLLAYSGKGRFLVQQTDLSKVVTEMTTLLSTIVSKKAVLDCNLCIDLPAIEGDPGQLRQVVMNLITNASDAVDERGGTIKVRTELIDATKQFLSKMYLDDELEPGRYILLEVSDDGCGMTSETLTRIFDPFFTTKFTGRGLGLAAVLGIVRSHGGALRVTSELNVGTVFTVIFPASEARETPEPPAAVVRKDGQTHEGLFLVVDDEERTREIIQDILHHYGYRVLLAENGVRAVELFREHASELSGVLLDLTMPKMNGEETWIELTQIRRDIPVILTSGYSEMEAANRFRGKQIAGFIQKPYHPDDLKHKLDELLIGRGDGVIERPRH